MLFNIHIFHSFISGVYLWVFMTILVERNVEEFFLEMRKKASIYGENHTAEQLPISVRCWIFLTKKFSQVEFRAR